MSRAAKRIQCSLEKTLEETGRNRNGVFQGNTPYATISISGDEIPDNRYYELDVTELVQEYVSGKYENTGFLIKAREEDENYIAFYSSNWQNKNQRPRLTIEYA